MSFTGSVFSIFAPLTFVWCLVTSSDHQQFKVWAFQFIATKRQTSDWRTSQWCSQTFQALQKVFNNLKKKCQKNNNQMQKKCLQKKIKKKTKLKFLDYLKPLIQRAKNVKLFWCINRNWPKKSNIKPIKTFLKVWAWKL